MAIEIVELPSYKMVIFHSYVKLPEGLYINIWVDYNDRTPFSFMHWNHGFL